MSRVEQAPPNGKPPTGEPLPRSKSAAHIKALAAHDAAGFGRHWCASGRPEIAAGNAKHFRKSARDARARAADIERDALVAKVVDGDLVGERFRFPAALEQAREDLEYAAEMDARAAWGEERAALVRALLPCVRPHRAATRRAVRRGAPRCRRAPRRAARTAVSSAGSGEAPPAPPEAPRGPGDGQGRATCGAVAGALTCELPPHPRGVKHRSGVCEWMDADVRHHGRAPLRRGGSR